MKFFRRITATRFVAALLAVLLTLGNAPASAFGLGKLGASLGHLGGIGGASSPKPYLPYEQVVATSGRYPSDMLAAPTASQVQLQTRRAIKTGGQPVWYFKLGYVGYGGPAETQLVSNYTIEASIECPTAPIASPPARVNFSGSTTRSVAPGENVVSDKVLASAYGWTSGVPPDTICYVRDNLTVAGTGASFTYPILGGANSGTVAPETNCQQFYSPLTASQVMNTGDMTLPAGGAAAAAYTPMVAVIGAATAPMVSLFLSGDSIVEWSRDTRNNGVNTAGGGIFVRAAQSVNGHQLPWSNFAIGGDTAFNYSTAGVLRKFWYKYFNYSSWDFGTNDIGALSRTTAQILPNNQTIWTDAKAGIGHVDQMLIIPRTSSTGTVWQTAADQAPIPNFGSGQTRDTLNTAITANIGSNGLDGTYDLSTALEDPTDHTKWRSGTILTGTVTGGSGYTNGTFNNAALTTLTGSGIGAHANVVVASGAVTTATIGTLGSTDNGHNFAVGDTLSSAAIGPGTGFVWTVATLQTLPYTPDGTHPQRYAFANNTPTGTSLVNGVYLTYVPSPTLAPSD